MAVPTASTSSARRELLQQGVPDEYVDSLLDEDYMVNLIQATNKQSASREKELQRYYLLNKIIFVVLVVQGVLGVWVAIYKTLFQPDFVYRSNLNLQNVDVTIMIDSSNHLQLDSRVQIDTVGNFTLAMKQAMNNNTQTLVQASKNRMAQLQEQGKSRLAKFLSFFFSTSKPPDNVNLKGAQFRVSTGFFNAVIKSQVLQNFTRNLTAQQDALQQGLNGVYEGYSDWYPALRRCVQQSKTSAQGTKNYCIIIGDNDAMCYSRHSRAVDQYCNNSEWADLFPPGVPCGTVSIEWADELNLCTDYVRLAFPNDMELIMMFTVSSDDARQVRLSSANFRNYIYATTNCTIESNLTQIVDDNGKVQTVQVYEEGADCLRFMMATGYDQLLDKSKRIAELLKNQAEEIPEPNGMLDYRYLFFLLLPLNLVFFVVWSKIIRLYSNVRMEAKKRMGKKKKMIKVTKTLVEKALPETAVRPFAVKMSEMELAEVASLRPQVEFNTPTTLRARLKGGFLKSQLALGICDGSGTPFDPNSFWSFEPVTQPPEGVVGLQAEQKVRIRNAKGMYIRAIDEGSRLLNPEDIEQASEFVVKPTDERGEEESSISLGDTIRLFCSNTGKYLQVQKDSSCNGAGKASQPETQFVLDRGGAAITAGSIISLRSASSGELLHATPAGAAQVLPGGENWRYWMVEKTGTTIEDGSSGGTFTGPSTFSEGASLNMSFGAPPSGTTRAPLMTIKRKTVTRADTNILRATATADAPPLKVGDIITLRGFNQKQLQVGNQQRCHCGDPSAPVQELSELEPQREGGDSPLPDLVEDGLQEFVIERVGMGKVTKHDRNIRKGMAICLKPFQRDSDTMGYVRHHPNGSVAANGNVSQREIVFVIDSVSVNTVITPLHDSLAQGDVELLMYPLWNKTDVKRIMALSSAWTDDNELSQFKGFVVVASDQGTYTVPKATGQGDDMWVAVINEGVDVVKAAKQAKSQGATGLIIRCEQALSLGKLAYQGADGEKPELPAVFVDKVTGEALNERGLVLKGSEFAKRHMTGVMRAIGKAALAPGSKANADVFNATANAMMVRWKEIPEKVHVPVEVEEEKDPSQANYKWKITTNTVYLRTNKKMKVNYGTKLALPPSARRKVQTEEEAERVDASATINPQTAASSLGTRRSVVGTAKVPAEDFAAGRIAGNLAGELSETLMEEDSAHQDLEQLDEESDFKIEYTFQEVEVAVGEKLEDLDEEGEEIQVMQTKGAVIGRLGVPMKKFWLVGLGLLLSTTVLLAILYSQVRGQWKSATAAPPGDSSDPMNAMAMDGGVQVSQFLQKVAAQLRGGHSAGLISATI